MSSSTAGSDAITPMPRPGQNTHYFNHDKGAASAITIDKSVRIATSNDASGVLRAQHELVTRALSQDFSMSAWSNVSNPNNVIRDCQPMESLNGQIHVPRSDSVLSSRPGTPHSAPSNFPIPSNPSSFPEDQRLTSPGPLLVMPQINVRQRRPYTENGRKIGKLRIMFCGDSGSGKTTLLRTILDRSADVAHYENTSGSEPGRPTTEINDVRASSQPYPAWRILSSASREDITEPVMERNLCLIDTPGYGLSAEASDAIDPILQYVEDQFVSTNDTLRENIKMSDDDFLGLIAAPQGGLTHIDAVIYCTTRELTETDLIFISRLSTYTTVIPVITKSDKHDAAQLEHLKAKVGKQLCDTAFEFFEPVLQDSTLDTHQVYTLSCLDPQIDASIMMTENYMPELVPSDLDSLLPLLLYDDRPARLRHYTARKFLAWKSRHQYEHSLICRPETEYGTLLPSADFTISRIAEHTKAEDQKSRLRVAAWASEIKQSFAMVRGKPAGSEHYAINEKSAEWLLTRMNDYVEEEKRANEVWQKREGRQYLTDEADPLGLLRARERWSRRLRKAFKWCLDLGFSVTGVFLCYSLWQRMSLT